MSGDIPHYDDRIVRFLGRLWGEGYLSPGGPDEVARVLEGLDLTGATVLDIGSGAGGASVDLVRRHGAGRVIGIDTAPDACEAARALVRALGLADRVEIREVAPGPLPFADESVDLVFSKDSIIHIPDKEALAREVFRVLRPGGWFAASDWLISHDDEPSPGMAHYIRCENLDFAMASPDRYRRALEAAGFGEVRLVNRNPWYRDLAREELARLTGPERAEFETVLTPDEVAAQIETWTAMVPVLESGEHCPHHLRGRKP